MLLLIEQIPEKNIYLIQTMPLHRLVEKYKVQTNMHIAQAPEVSFS